MEAEDDPGRQPEDHRPYWTSDWNKTHQLGNSIAGCFKPELAIHSALEIWVLDGYAGGLVLHH